MAPQSADNVSVLDILCKDKVREANDHKSRRDGFSADAKNWALRRDQYRDRSKDALREAKEMQKVRDAINMRAGEAKVRRDEIHARATELKGKDKEAFEKVREEGNAVHEEMLRIVEEGHAANDKMADLFDEAKVDRVLAEAAHKKFIECRKSADAEHRAYLRTLDEVRDMRRGFSGKEE